MLIFYKTFKVPESMVKSHLNINNVESRAQKKEKITKKPRGFNYNSLTSNIGESIKSIKKT